jgi:creatinine amidohydrolase/Fe(II)-dependent formamide hydrolase-like protein
MAHSSTTRQFGELTFQEVAARLRANSILCLPLGAIEQHGPHLPLNTDVIVAEGVTRRLIARWGAEFDLWQLPTVAVGLSREHDWAPGTLSLSVAGFATLLRELARDLTRSLAARNLVFVNGHGGNRGVLDNLLHELRGDFALNCCVIHPFDLGRTANDPESHDVHGGRSETSVMLALAPDLVRRESIGPAGGAPDPQALQALIFDRGASFPWRTDDPRLARDGIIGNAAAASAEEGEAILDAVVAAAGEVFARLLDNGRLMPPQTRPRP